MALRWFWKIGRCLPQAKRIPLEFLQPENRSCSLFRSVAKQSVLFWDATICFPTLVNNARNNLPRVLGCFWQRLNVATGGNRLYKQ